MEGRMRKGGEEEDLEGRGGEGRKRGEEEDMEGRGTCRGGEEGR